MKNKKKLNWNINKLCIYSFKKQGRKYETKKKYNRSEKYLQSEVG